MPNLFPPGAIPSEGADPDATVAVRSPWRETEFWIMTVESAIVPTLSIEAALANWSAIRSRLMEHKRRRRSQVDEIMLLI